MRNQNSQESRQKGKIVLHKLNKVFLMIAFLHWILTFFTDHLIFEYVMWDLSNVTQMVKTAMTYGAKAVFLLVLVGIYQGLYRFFAKADRRFVKYTLIYFCINLVLLLLVWPGIWRMDEFGILNSAVKLLPVFWQNYLTSLFYVFSLMLIPVPSGVIIVQCAFISLMAGYMINFFVKRFGKAGILAFIPCLFFPVLDSNLYPMRMSLYGFMELFLLVLIWEKRQNVGNMPESSEEERADEKLQGRKRDSWLFICILAGLVTVWRTEAVYYFILFPLLLVILFVKKLGRKRLVKIICGYLACALCLFVPQTAGDKLTSGNQYDLTSVVLPLVPLVNEAYGREDCKEQLEAIDQVIDVEIAVAGAKEGKSGISLFWSEPDFQKTYMDSQYGEFKSAYYDLILKFPQTFLAERWDCFIHSVDLLQNTTELFTAKGVANYDTFRSYAGTKPFHDELRSTVIKVLEWRQSDDYESKKAGYGVIYTALIPIGILLAVWAVCLVKRRWHGFFMLSLPLVKVPLVFLTAPSRLFMYYYSLYLIGYFLGAYLLIALLVRVWKRAGSPVKKTVAYAKRNGVKAAFDAVMERVDKKHRDEMWLSAASYEGCKEWSHPFSWEQMQQEQELQRNKQFSYEPLISIVVPAYETEERFLKELLDSVKGQTYGKWELLIADASKSEKVKDCLLEDWAQDYPDARKIRYIRLKENGGISQNTNRAIEEASGEYIALLDHDDVLTQDALYSMVEAVNQEDNRESVLAVYSDEDKCDGSMERFYEPHFKPDFNLDLLLSNNYICHFLMVKASVMKELKLRKEFDGAQDYDLVLRLAARLEMENGKDIDAASVKVYKNRILHVPKVLYHWRCHEGSTAGNTESKRYAYDAGRRALEEYYRLTGISEQVKVTDSPHLGFYRTSYTPDIFAVRKDVAAVCGRVLRKGIVAGGPELIYKDGKGHSKSLKLFQGLRKNSSGYMHRASLFMDADRADARALRLRPDLDCTLEKALASGMKLVYDPEFVVNEDS